MEENKVMENPVDINDMSAASQNDQDDTSLSCDLLCGTTISFDVDAMDWGDLYNRIPSAGETANWTGAMKDGATRQAVLDYFSDDHGNDH